MKIKIPELRHYNCANERCNSCMKDHIDLEKYLDSKCKTKNKVDHLGKYYTWCGKNNIRKETDYGWATQEVFNITNINNYIKQFKGGKQ